MGAGQTAGSPADGPERLRQRRPIVLVCGACEKRSKGPRKFGTKDVARRLQRACGDAGMAKPRIVRTACMGACPKKAVTVAAAAAGGDGAMIAFRKHDDPAAAVAMLFGAAATP